MRARTSRPVATPALLDPPRTAAARPPGERNQDPLPCGPPAAGDTPRHVINATSVLVHPGLGRAVLSGSARRAVAVATGCTDLEYDLHNGQRGRRGRETVAALLAAVPTAAAAYVVNSNPAALVLAATVLAPGRELVISRRELYEIRDGFRLPELLTSTGARLCPVGTADGAVLEDYRQAVWSGTGCVLTLGHEVEDGQARGVGAHPGAGPLRHGHPGGPAGRGGPGRPARPGDRGHQLRPPASRARAAR